MNTSAEYHLRPLTPDDLDAVVAIDRKHSGESRRGFYEKRLERALRNPKGFIYVGVCEGDTLAGFAFARLLGGEFGREDAVAALDAIGVDPARHGAGLGRRLMAGLEEVMRKKGVRELQTQANWTNQGLLRFLGAAGFQTAPRIVLERDVSEPFAE
jgi:GNAT superfamily N-acetyltransferase